MGAAALVPITVEGGPRRLISVRRRFKELNKAAIDIHMR
jgi:hypothetical protein